MNQHPATMAVAMTTLLLSVLVAGVAGDVANCKTYAKKTERIKGKDCSCYSSCPSGYTDDGEHTDCSICLFNPVGCDTEWCKRAVDDKTKCSTCNSGYIIKNNKCVRVCTTDAGKCTSQSECVCADPLMDTKREVVDRDNEKCWQCRAGLGGLCGTSIDSCADDHVCDFLLGTSIGTCEWKRCPSTGTSCTFNPCDCADSSTQERKTGKSGTRDCNYCRTKDGGSCSPPPVVFFGSLQEWPLRRDEMPVLRMHHLR